jgi:hypothetical protein
VIHFRILDETLCGAEYTEPSAKAAKNGRLCDDCIQVMWKEQYRRNTALKVKVKVKTRSAQVHRGQVTSRTSMMIVKSKKKDCS